MKELAKTLRQEFPDKDYRHAYVDEFLNAWIATQLKVLREQRGWTQEHMAELVNMKQPRVSLLETVDYSAWSLSTLKRFARAFDLTLNVSFESFGTKLMDILRFSRESLEKFSFDEDPVVQIDLEPLKAGALKASLEQSARPLQGDNILDLAAYRRDRERQRGALQHWQAAVSTVAVSALRVPHRAAQTTLFPVIGL